MLNASTRNYIELLLMSAIWGSSFLFLRIAAPEFGPFLLIQMRVLTAVIVMLPICMVFGKWGELIANWRIIFLVSLTNMAVPFCLFAYAALSGFWFAVYHECDCSVFYRSDRVCGLWPAALFAVAVWHGRGFQRSNRPGVRP